MKQVISALERQIRIEEMNVTERQIMLSNKDKILFNKPLPDANPQYLEELKKVKKFYL